MLEIYFLCRERLAKEAEEAAEAARQKAEDDAKREVEEQGWRMEQLDATDHLVFDCLSKVSAAEEKEKQQKQVEFLFKLKHL
jgi:hypothetical protein